MKIFLVIPSLARGGAERAAVRLAGELAKRHVVTLCLYRNQIEYSPPPNVKLQVLNTEGLKFLSKIKNSFLRILYLRRMISKEKFDVFLSFMGNLQPILTGKRVIVSIRNNPLYFPFSVKAQLYTAYHFSNVTKIVAVSKKIAAILRKKFFLENVIHIYNPIDLVEIQRFSEISREELSFPYILSVGRLHSQKNFSLLIKAFARSKLRDKYKLIILGEGPERKKLEKLVLELGMKGKIFLPGKVSNPYPFMRNARFFVLTSNYEGFPNVLLESLACGTPVIATNCDTGPDEIVEHGKNGLLVPVGNEEALVYAMEEFDQNKELYKRCKICARESVRRFDIKIIADQWESLFEEVLNER